MTDLVVLGIVSVIGIVITCIPKKWLDVITDVFSLQTYGIRTIRRRNDQTDTLTNCILFVCFLFSVGYCFIPYSFVLYSVLFAVSFLCLIAQTNRVTADLTPRERFSLLSAVWFMSTTAYVGAIGMFNQHQAEKDTAVFIQSLYAHELQSVLYFLTHHEFMTVTLQIVVFFVSFYVVWAQFKYMRLENTYKANNLINFWIKTICVCLLLIGLSFGGFYCMNRAYYV